MPEQLQYARARVATTQSCFVSSHAKSSKGMPFMVRMLRLAVIAGAALALSGAAAMAQFKQSLDRTVLAGRTTKIDSAHALNPDCSVMGVPEIRITAPPAHGTAIVRKAPSYTTFAQSDQRFACNTRATMGVELLYRPQAGYVGDDRLSVEAFFPGGIAGTRSYSITVK